MAVAAKYECEDWGVELFDVRSNGEAEEMTGTGITGCGEPGSSQILLIRDLTAGKNTHLKVSENRKTQKV